MASRNPDEIRNVSVSLTLKLLAVKVEINGSNAEFKYSGK